MKRTTTKTDAATKGAERRAEIKRIAAAYTAIKDQPCVPAWFAWMQALPREKAYSDKNVEFLIGQMAERGVDPLTITDLRGFAQWRDAGRMVRKGEHGYMVHCPVAIAKGEDEFTLYMKAAYVFDISQTEASA